MLTWQEKIIVVMQENATSAAQRKDIAAFFLATACRLQQYDAEVLIGQLAACADRGHTPLVVAKELLDAAMKEGGL